MVDVENKIVYFGYGDVSVGGSGLGSMTFSNLDPSYDVGTMVECDDPRHGATLEVFEDDTWELMNLFKTVTKENRIVKYKDVTFDFSNYNEDSVKVCIKKGYETVSQLALAC